MSNFVQKARGILRPLEAGLALDRLDLQTLRVSEVVKLPRQTIGGTANFTVSPDARWIVFPHLDQTISELMMLENFR